ncbi:MAG: deubiquitinating enzyme [Tremellales sp. Tagirdzhanova-0007]|nr:MAG: deubiquitinating enzyme [Tremellales sp. Tagirdzhanova-0007]
MSRRARSALTFAGPTSIRIAGPGPVSLGGPKKQGWKRWFKDWTLRRKRGVKGVESIHLLPGWAVQYHRETDKKKSIDVRISIEGFCRLVDASHTHSRLHRAFLTVARRFAALPKLPSQAGGSSLISRQSSVQLHHDVASNDLSFLISAHANLNARLRPFWSTVLPRRRVAVSVYTSPSTAGQEGTQKGRMGFQQYMLLHSTILTDTQGHFFQDILIPWENLRDAPLASPSIDGRGQDLTPSMIPGGWYLDVVAELSPDDRDSDGTLGNGILQNFDDQDQQHTVPTTHFPIALPSVTKVEKDQTPDSLAPRSDLSRAYATTRVSHCKGVRVVSDLDDTVKHSDILAGPRQVFRNVFCRPVKDLCVKGMNELYRDMAATGVDGFHYVSNSPLELLQSVQEFLKVHHFPEILSLRLKSYGSRSMVSSMFNSARKRKRESICAILDAFMDSRFLLFGDSGEHDLEIYLSIARERPRQVIGVFIRDVTGGRLQATVRNVISELPKQLPQQASQQPDGARPMQPPSSANKVDGDVQGIAGWSYLRSASASDPMIPLDGMLSEFEALTVAQRKALKRAAEWETRVANARNQMPKEISLVFFRSADEITMSALQLICSRLAVKHAGVTHSVQMDPKAPATTFKDSIYRVTGVPPDRMKVMVKGGILKDDADLSKLGLKPNQAITVIGTAGPLPSAPSQPTVFLEDMDQAALALHTRTPPGLVNLGQTCYLNSSLQVLRAMPQLHIALDQSSSSVASPEHRLTGSIKNLFSGMQQTTAAVPPFVLLYSLRAIAPQFAEQDSRGSYAQQDADEAWTQIISALRSSLPGSSSAHSFIDEYMSIELTRVMQCAEAPEESPTTTSERVLKLECNITIATNFMLSGILDVSSVYDLADMQSLDQEIEKISPSLGRPANYKLKSRLSRLPAYLAVHMVGHKSGRTLTPGPLLLETRYPAKIMRKVKYPLQLDASDLVTDEVRTKIQPINSAVRSILKIRDDRATEAKRSRGKEVPGAMSEAEVRSGEKASIDALVKDTGSSDVGANPSGMYELCAMVTHKGASADSGHYIGWTRSDNSVAASGEEEWFKFDDDKVSSVTADKIVQMDGGGEDSVAYILLYRAVEI